MLTPKSVTWLGQTAAPHRVTRDTFIADLPRPVKPPEAKP